LRGGGGPYKNRSGYRSMGTNLFSGPVIIGEGVMVLNSERVDLD